jgi:transcriptional regulator with XRE-family HTH domain
MGNGKTLKATQKRLRLKDAEICAEAGVSIGTLRRVYADHPNVTEESVNKVLRALEALRQKMAIAINSKAAG